MLLSVADVALGPGQVSGEGSIRIVTAAPGSNHDWGARLTAQELAPRIGQKVIVENRGSIAIEYVAKDVPPDGYTLLFYGAFVWLQPYLAKVNWDPLADLTPITLAITSPSVLVVHPSLPVKTVKEMIALAQSAAGRAELRRRAAAAPRRTSPASSSSTWRACDIVRVRYKGTGPSMIGLLTGRSAAHVQRAGPDRCRTSSRARMRAAGGHHAEAHAARCPSCPRSRKPCPASKPRP